MHILIPEKKFAAIINLIQGVLEDVELKEESEEVIQVLKELQEKNRIDPEDVAKLMQLKANTE